MSSQAGGKTLKQRMLESERKVLHLFLAIIVVTVFFGVLVRYTPITGSTLGTAEFARLTLLWLVFWAGGSAERFGGHFRFELVETALPRKISTPIQVITRLILVVCVGVLVWGSIGYAIMGIGEETYLLQWPQWIKRISLVIGSSILLTYTLAKLISKLRGQIT